MESFFFLKLTHFEFFLFLPQSFADTQGSGRGIRCSLHSSRFIVSISACYLHVPHGHHAIYQTSEIHVYWSPWIFFMDTVFLQWFYPPLGKLTRQVFGYKVFSDKAHFQLDVYVDQQNYWIWDAKTPRKANASTADCILDWLSGWVLFLWKCVSICGNC